MKEQKVLNNVTNILIGEFVKIKVGETIPPYSKLEDIANCGSGTIKKALEELETLGCFVFERSARSTTLVSKDLNMCSYYYSFDNLVLKLPKESSFRIDKLTHACLKSIDNVSINYEVISNTLVSELLNDQIQLGIISKRMYKMYEDKLALLYDFGNYSYAKYSIVKLENTPEVDKLKIGKNSSDFDLAFATDNTFTGYGFEFVDVRNSQIRTKLHDNEIQMAIVDRDDFDSFQFEVVDFDYDIDATKACLVCASYNEELLKSTINMDLLATNYTNSED